MGMIERKKRLMMMRNNFPSGYTRLKYVYCNGSQPYIRVTGFQNITTNLDLKVKQDAGHSAEQGMCGEISKIELYYENNELKTWYSGGARIQTISTSYGNIDEIIARVDDWNDTNPYFNLGTYKLNAYRYYGKIYSLRLTDGNNSLLYDFVPCIRNSDNEIGFIDMVAKVFYPPQSKAKFIAGY